ncbi:hypothetical protein CGMCC3_g13636 [Colletotrichum fructicola]|nr:uncharacterized protein CGMCC3_g13636 [Colletotrichum fructicola]KAE9570305.1 hypothetical protein CGMCC3_g13636 [Colletotrichum fructicola]
MGDAPVFVHRLHAAARLLTVTQHSSPISLQPGD